MTVFVILILVALIARQPSSDLGGTVGAVTVALAIILAVWMVAALPAWLTYFRLKRVSEPALVLIVSISPISRETLQAKRLQMRPGLWSHPGEQLGEERDYETDPLQVIRCS
jgi:hypothetical protein